MFSKLLHKRTEGGGIRLAEAIQTDKKWYFNIKVFANTIYNPLDLIIEYKHLLPPTYTQGQVEEMLNDFIDDGRLPNLVKIENDWLEFH